jgi:hypothetical protein
MILLSSANVFSILVVNTVHMLVLDVDAYIGARVRLEGGSRY